MGYPFIIKSLFLGTLYVLFIILDSYILLFFFVFVAGLYFKILYGVIAYGVGLR